MGNDMLKWEDGGGLKHHCPICQTPLSHDKCRTQCLGVHVEWCGRYHTLFRKNWSSRCSACKTTDEQHEKRHREIAELIAKINKLRADEDAAAMEPSTPRTSMTPTPLTASALNNVQGLSNDSTPTTKKKERKQLKKAAKAKKRDKFVTSANILCVADTLHPKCEQEEVDEEGAESAETAEEMDIRMNLKFNTSTCNTKTARHDFIKKDRIMDLEEHNADVERVLAALGMSSKTTGDEAKLIAELTTAIQNDLVHHHDELRTTAKNRSAFWRWANMKAYRELIGNGKDWDDHTPTPTKERSDSIEELRAANEAAAAAAAAAAEAEAEATAAAIDTDEDEKSERNGSVDSSVVAGSASTSVTVPSIETSLVKKKPKPKTLTLVLPPKSTEPVGDPGWKQVGKKVLKTPTTGTLKMVKNGGLHRLAQSPKGTYGALTEAWTGPVNGDGKPLR